MKHSFITPELRPHISGTNIDVNFDNTVAEEYEYTTPDICIISSRDDNPSAIA